MSTKFSSLKSTSAGDTYQEIYGLLVKLCFYHCSMIALRLDKEMMSKKASKFYFDPFLPSKVPTDTSNLSSCWTNLTNTWVYESGLESTEYQISDNLVQQGLRYGVYDGTFEGKKGAT